MSGYAVALVVVSIVVGLPAAAQTTVAAKAAAKAQRDAEVAKRERMAGLRQQLIDRLKDADSAKFRSEFLSLKEDNDGITSLCGEINAKNSYGGYTGFVGFVVTPGGTVMTADDDTGAAFGEIWQVWCKRPV